MTVMPGQDSVAPMWLNHDSVVTTENGLGWVWWAAGMALVGLLAIAAWVVHRERIRRNAGAVALARIARSQGVSGDLLESVRKAATAHGGVTPLSILVSDTALTAAFGAVASTCGPDVIAGWRRLFDARGVAFPSPPLPAGLGNQGTPRTKGKAQRDRGRVDRGPS